MRAIVPPSQPWRFEPLPVRIRCGKTGFGKGIAAGKSDGHQMCNLASVGQKLFEWMDRHDHDMLQ